MYPAISLSELTKTYSNGVCALKKISMDIPRGEIFGFLGPNGSGKTTTVRLLNGILEKTSGEASILGMNVSSSNLQLHSHCGVMTETAAPYKNLSGTDNLIFFGMMHGMSRTQAVARAAELLSMLSLKEAASRRAGTYSSGMKKRLCLAIAMMHHPQLLFLDEPTSGLDPESALQVLDMIRRLATENEVTIFLCTHQLRYAEGICTLYGFLDKGELVAFGNYTELLNNSGLKIKFRIRADKIPDGYTGTYDRGVLIQEKDAKSVSDQECSAIIRELVTGGADIFEAEILKPSLEDLYFHYIGNNQHGQQV